MRLGFALSVSSASFARNFSPPPSLSAADVGIPLDGLSSGLSSLQQLFPGPDALRLRCHDLESFRMEQLLELPDETVVLGVLLVEKGQDERLEVVVQGVQGLPVHLADEDGPFSL